MNSPARIAASARPSLAVHRRLISAAVLYLAAMCFQPQAIAATFNASDADCLFNWGEAHYATLFAPPGAQSLSFKPYYYRYYSQTNSYLGISSTDNHLYYIGVPSGNSLLDLGSASSWYTTSGCVGIASTIAITSYMSMISANSASTFDSDAHALVNQLAARGLLCSGNMYVAVKDLKLSHVQSFVNNAVAYVQTTKNAGYSLDKPAIMSLVNGYKTQDLAWLTSYTWANCEVSQGVIGSLAQTFNPAVNFAYDNAVAQINLM